MSNPYHAYLGDGLYARYEYGQIILETQRQEGKHWVALEPEVLRALIDFNKDAIDKAEGNDKCGQPNE